MKIQLLASDAEHQKELDKTGFWGRAGAGCLFVAADTKNICIAHRSADVLEPGTWGTWGGAIDRNETPEKAIKREIVEETSYIGQVKLIHLYTFKHSSGFQYHNYFAVVPHEFVPKMDWETQNYKWTDLNKLPKPLHPGMKHLLQNAGTKMKTLIAKL